MTVAVIVQARFGSTRLRGKVLERLNDETVLAEVLVRCRAIPGADLVCCAVPVGGDDDPVAVAAAAAGASVFRGNELDVLGRYAGAARAHAADVVLRVTSDCPLIDPEVCGAVLRLVVEQDYDYACNNRPPTWPHGLDCEAVVVRWLEKAAAEATAADAREHVTPFIVTHPGARRANLRSADPTLARHRWTLDTADDLAFLRRLFPLLPAGRDGWPFAAALAALDGEPGLADHGSARTGERRGPASTQDLIAGFDQHEWAARRMPAETGSVGPARRRPVP